MADQNDPRLGGYRPTYLPQPIAENNILGNYMRQRGGDHVATGTINGIAGLAALAPAFMSDDPVSAWLARGLAASMGASAADQFQRFGATHNAAKMWDNTGMPQRPGPDEQNALLRLYQMRDQFGGDGQR